MSNIIRASFVLMGAGMGVVFITLAIFFVMIVVLEKLFKNDAEKSGDE